MNKTSIILKTSYRFYIYDYWSEVNLNSPIRIESKINNFLLIIKHDMENLKSSDYKSGMLLCECYLFDRPSQDVFLIISGGGGSINKHLGFKGTHDGLEVFGDAYANYIKDKATAISILVTKVLNLIGWRLKSHGVPPDVKISPSNFFWSELYSDIENMEDFPWKQIPLGIIEIGCPNKDQLVINENIGAEVSALIDENVNLSKGYELFNEAWRIHKGNQSSALVMAVAAAETRVKEFIKFSSPDASWLVENLASPPLTKILKYYIPTFKSHTTNELVPEIPKEWYSTMHKAIEDRNKVVHGVSLVIDEAYIVKILNVVHEILYFFDFHSGYVWANNDK